MNDAGGALDELLCARLQIERLSDSLRLIQLELEQTRLHLAGSAKNAAIGRVSAAIAQELNDPLQAITNVLGGLHRRGKVEPDDMPLLDLAYGEVMKLTSLITELREFYQPTHGKTDLVDLQIELERVIAANSTRLSGQGITITTESAGKLPLIHAVAAQLRTVFQCLLDNALDFCRPDDAIHFVIARVGDVVELRIEDCNRCLGQALEAQFFDPFAMSLSKKSGQSLELAKCYAIIANHGGTLATEPDPEKGFRFKMILPIDNVSGPGIDGTVEKLHGKQENTPGRR